VNEVVDRRITLKKGYNFGKEVTVGFPLVRIYVLFY
jgi:hypothetical protein